eukprot:483840-Pleurochrysis_carterae.AAC.1
MARMRWHACDGVRAVTSGRGGVMRRLSCGGARPMACVRGRACASAGRGKARMRWRVCALRACD